MFQCPFVGRAALSRLLIFVVAAGLSIGNSRAQNILREYWLGIGGSSIGDLTGNPAFPNSPSGREFVTIFEGPTGWAENYGTRFRGFVKPPTTGNYTFWIAGDDQCELWLSTDETVGNKRLIARVVTWTASRVWEEPRDGNSAAQRSIEIRLETGRKYYIEALQKEGGGGDCIAVGWRLPNGTLERPIPGSRLESYQASVTAPVITREPEDVTAREGSEVRFVVTATGMEPMSFQWRRGGQNLPIERDATLIMPRVQLSDDGALVDCVITNDRGTATTRQARLTVLPENVPPTVTQLTPPVGSAVRQLSRVEVTFSEAVVGVDASDLLVNNTPAASVSGSAAGPFIFEFPAVSAGPAALRWADGHNIVDLSRIPNAFAGGSWTVNVNPNLAAPQIRISEIMAANENGIVDEDEEPRDWIEIHNYGNANVNLGGLSLSDDRNIPGLWVFPNVTLNAGARIVVFASAKDRRAPAAGERYHTNFELGQGGEFLAIYNAESPREIIHALDEYPEQRVNYSYGINAQDEWRYYSTPTPGAANGVSDILGILPPPHFSSKRGFYPNGITLHLTTDVPGAEIRYSINGNDPTVINSTLYTAPIAIAQTRAVRASLFKPGYLPSVPETHTYIVQAAAQRRTMPAIAVTTSGTNLTGPTGIIGINGGTWANGPWQPVNPGDYHNPSQHGFNWERPTSAEFFYPSNTTGFQIDCGIRVQGSDWRRPRYQPGSKFSYRLYFRGDYGEGKLEFPLFENSPVKHFDQVVLRAGHNDETNPFIKDELMRTLFVDCGQVGSHGDFGTLYVNGVYKGYYNYTERIEKNFCQAHHGGSDDWDVLAQGPDPLDGDTANFQLMRSYITGQPMTVAANYLGAAQRLDLVNFIDYLLVNIYGANGDWPHNNWRAARERVASGIWRFYVWDAEFALGTYGRTPQHDSFSSELSGGSEIPAIYQALRQNPEFRLLWADRIQKHFFNGGALTDENVRRNYDNMRNKVAPLIGAFDTYIGDTWIPQRRGVIMQHFQGQGLLSAPGVPTFSQFGGRVPTGYQLTMTTSAAGATIYYTTDGTDPRVMFTGAVAPTATAYVAGQPVRLGESVVVKARARTSAGVWTAVNEARFEVGEFGAPLRFTEIMYNSPPTGDALDFVEMKNFSNTRLNVSGMEFDGISFRFPENSWIEAGEVFVIASAAGANGLFAARYPNVTPRGWYENNLNNGGELIRLLDRFGNIVAWVNYDDASPWPSAADGQGYSLELVSRDLDPNSVGSWRRSNATLGSPGVYQNSAEAALRFNEVAVRNGATPGFIELQNTGGVEANLTGHTITHTDSGRRFTFPGGTIIPPGELLAVTCDFGSGGGVLHTGFELSAFGGTILLTDSGGNRVDAIDLGRQVPGYSVGLINGVLVLNTPTRLAANIEVGVGFASEVFINEWLANALPGAPDWIELYNRSDAPAALRGMTLNIGNAFFRIPTHTFIAGRGYIQLIADENPVRERLNFKLPAAGATIRLYDAAGMQVNQVIYTSSLENVTDGRMPDGAGTISRFRGSASPAAANYLINVTSPLVINEVMSRNARAFIDPFGGAADWVELFNSGAQPLSLEGLALSDNSSEAGQWRFPAMTLDAGAYLVVWFDKTHPARAIAGQPLNTGRALGAEGGGVYLFNATGQILDQVEFGWQIADRSIGRVGGVWNLMNVATPGAANSAAPTLGAATALRINEWRAATADSPAWLEIMNTATLPVALAGVSLTDDLSWAGTKKYVFPPLSFIAASGFVHLENDDGIKPGTVEFNIAGAGEALRLYTSAVAVIDSVYFGAMPVAATLGRFPDGAGNPLELAPSRGVANYKSVGGIVINEVAPAENTIEFRNVTDADIDIGSWTLTDLPLAATPFAFPAQTIVPARGYLTFAPTTFTLDRSFGGSVVLIKQPTREQARFNYGAGEAGDTYGRWPTSIGLIEPLLVNSTPGAANGYPSFGPVIIREIMYHPAPSQTSDEADLEYVELWNPTPFAAEMFNWRIGGGIDFNFPADMRLGANGLVVIVGFNPATETAKLAAFQSRYPSANGARILGPMRGRLGNGSDTVELLRPTAPDARNYIPHIAVDRVSYGTVAPWPLEPDGTGKSLHRMSGFANDAFNWHSSDATPGGNPEFDSFRDTDDDGISDSIEVAFGFDPNNAADGGLDNDSDGISNRDELMVGTDPTDPASAGFRVETAWGDVGPAVQFHALAGARYEIQFRDEFGAGQWERHSIVGPFDTAGFYSFQALAPEKTQRFYRVIHGPAN